MSKPAEIYGRHWSEREYIIVLHYYMQNRGQPRHHLCAYVLEASRLLGRTPGAVVMRMENYASLDPNESATRKGLVNVSDQGVKIFRQWLGQDEALKSCAEVLIREIQHASQPSLFDPDPIRLPRAFGKYELLDPLGEGSFGSVFSCMNSETQQIYAMKIIKVDAIQNEEVVGRCRREIKALKEFKHPSIISIYEDNLDQERQFPGFIMDIAEQSLSIRLDQYRRTHLGDDGRSLLPTEEALKILDDVMSAVEAMHLHTPSLIHRDINPNNILQMRDGRWVLADFSLAKFLITGTSTVTFATRTQAWGTVQYTAPEQWKDFAQSDHRADIYSIGVLIWELFSPSWPPFARDELLLSDKLSEIVLKATERERDKRYQSAAELRLALNNAFQ